MIKRIIIPLRVNKDYQIDKNEEKKWLQSDKGNFDDCCENVEDEQSMKRIMIYR